MEEAKTDRKKKVIRQDALYVTLPLFTGEKKWPADWNMPKEKIEAFVKQFTFVRGLVNDSLNRVYVSGINLEVAGRDLRTLSVGNYENTTYYYEWVYLLDDKGNPVTRVEEYTVKCWPKWLGFFPKFWKKQIFVQRERTHTGVARSSSDYYRSIDISLKNLAEEGEKVKMVLSYHAYSGVTIVYRVPKGYNLVTWLQHLRDEEVRRHKEAVQNEEKQIQKEIGEIEEPQTTQS